MPTPFDNNPKFQSLSDEAKTIVMNKYNSMSDEAKTIVASKLNQSMDNPARTKLDLMTQGKIIPPELKSQGVPQSIFNEKATDIAEGLAQSGHNPKLAAAAGEAFALIPTAFDAATTIPTILGAPKITASAGKAILESNIGQALRNTGAKQVTTLTEEAANQGLQQANKLSVLETAKGNIGQLLDTAKSQAQKLAQTPVTNIKESIKELPLIQRTILGQANESLVKAKLAIGSAEKELGIDISQIGGKQIRPFLNNIKGFADKYISIAENIGEKGLAESTDLKTLQTIRKAAQEAAKSGGIDDLTRSALYKIENTFRGAILQSSDVLAEANNNFRNATLAVQKLPTEFKTQKETLSLALTKAQNLAKEKVLTDPKTLQLNRIADILERKSTELPKQFAVQKQTLDLAILKARNLAAKQSVIRKTIGTIATVGVGGAVAQKLLH